MIQKSAIVIGAGIVGLAISRALAIRGFHVTVIERNHKAVGASIRNFGMVLPIAQPDGILFDRAMSSRNIWKEVCDSAKIWYDEVGSLQLGYAKDEWNVLSELKDVYNHRGYELLDRKKTLEKSPAVVAENLYGSLFSKNEIIVDPRMAIFQMPKWLNEKYNVNFIWGKAVSRISHPSVYCGNESFQADEIFVCTGSDFETLYPEAFDEMNITKCKLQMMRLITQPNNWRIGPMLCGGLSLINYYSFTKAPSLDLLKKRLHEEYPEYIRPIRLE